MSQLLLENITSTAPGEKLDEKLAGLFLPADYAECGFILFLYLQSITYAILVPPPSSDDAAWWDGPGKHVTLYVQRLTENMCKIIPEVSYLYPSSKILAATKETPSIPPVIRPFHRLPLHPMKNSTHMPSHCRHLLPPFKQHEKHRRRHHLDRPNLLNHKTTSRYNPILQHPLAVIIHAHDTICTKTPNVIMYIRN